MSTYRTDPKTGRALIAPENKVGKDGKTPNEKGEKPPAKPEAAKGDPEAAKRAMRALGMHGLADMYEVNGNAAANGELPPFFSGHPYAGAIQNANNSKQGNVNVLKEDEPVESENVAAQGDDSRVESPPQGEAAQINYIPGLLPLPNELERFASYNNIFTFGCISPDELNFPDETYRKVGVKSGQHVLRSGGGLTSPKKPRTAAEAHYEIDTQYFIDNVDIETVIAPNRESRMTNFHSLSFEIREPYSMGQLLQTMQLAAENAGYKNYLEAPWLLTINFLGFEDLRKEPSLSASQRMLPCKIVSVDFNVDTEGSIYRFSCSAFNDEAFTDGSQNLPCDVTIYGSDLEEICQSGLGSLATAINTHLLKGQQYQDEKIEQDEYIFSFPQITDSGSVADILKQGTAEAGGLAVTGDEYIIREGIDYSTVLQTLNTDTQAYNMYNSQGSPHERNRSIDVIQQEYVDSLLGYSIKRGNLSESIKKTIANRDQFVNAIGKNSISPDQPTEYGDSPFGKANFVLNATNGTLERGNTVIDPKRRTIQFRAGTPIQRVLEEVVLLSNFGQHILKKDLQDKSGQIPWFRLESDLYIVNDPDTEKVIGRMPRIYVYKIVPYMANTSIFKMPNDPPTGYNELVRQAAKAYNYMYTGLNKDILEFDIKFENAFYRSISTDYNNNSGNNDPSNQSSTQESTTVAQGGSVGSTAAQNMTNVQSENSFNKSNQLAGAMTETAEVRVARQFNEALANSDVDLLTMTIKVLGDPYFIADSGTGNYNAQTTSWTNVNADGSINHQSGQVDILLNFLTPIDIDPQVGNYKMDGPAVGVSNFSGLYMVIGVNNNFSNNVFTQEIELVKRPNFDLKDLDEQNKKKLAKIQDDYQKQIDAAIQEYGEDSPQAEFARLDTDASGRLSSREIVTGGLSFDQATKLARDASQPPPVKPPPQQYDDAILRNQRRMQQGQVSGATATDSAKASENVYQDAILRGQGGGAYSSATVNNATTATVGQQADQTVNTINDPTADLSSGWVPPSQRGVQ